MPPMPMPPMPMLPMFMLPMLPMFMLPMPMLPMLFMPGLNNEKNDQNQHQIVLRACSRASCESHQTPCSRKTCWINWTLNNPHQRPGAVGIVHAHSLTASVRKAETQMCGRSTPRTKRTQHGLFASDSNDLQIWIRRVRGYSHNSQKLCHTTIYSHTENVYKALHNKAEDVYVCVSGLWKDHAAYHIT